jgi:hypothetical protein
VIGRDHDDEHGKHGVEQDQPPPPARADLDDGKGDQARPGKVHRGHGRHLIGDSGTRRPIHGLVKKQTGVDEAHAGQQSGRRDRDEV